MNHVITVENTCWINRELELFYMENRMFSEDDDMLSAHLEVKNFKGEVVYMDDVDSISWELVTSSSYQVESKDLQPRKKR